MDQTIIDLKKLAVVSFVILLLTGCGATNVERKTTVTSDPKTAYRPDSRNDLVGST